MQTTTRRVISLSPSTGGRDERCLPGGRRAGVMRSPRLGRAWAAVGAGSRAPSLSSVARLARFLALGNPMSIARMDANGRPIASGGSGAFPQAAVPSLLT
jgi:hypothetical protein